MIRHGFRVAGQTHHAKYTTYTSLTSPTNPTPRMGQTSSKILGEFDNQGWGASASQPRPLDALMREEDEGHKQAQAQAQSPRTSLDTGSRAITRASFAEKGNSRKSLDLSHLHGNMKGAVEILTREHGIF
uniref:Uncharacterized protein n=1 Tax=Mantoniella antarctica TaxID=81844 RepID=A0A7S0XGA5_9CHLO|mmetsp:Transcript_4602/g.11364  ORF Transcript_4602/g.11364 Transcript_4602/m.11364 type:complete len:130 (+) Transcript_4602:35-424(+)